MATEEYSIGYEEGYQDGWNAALEPTKNPKPVAWITDNYAQDSFATTYCADTAKCWRDKGWRVAPLYDEPPRKEWVGLTDEEVMSVIRDPVDEVLDHIYENGTAAEGVDFRMKKIARAIEAKLKEKNS